MTAGLLRSLVLASLVACGLEEWRNADVQLEIEGATLDTETPTRICVEGVGTRSKALKAGRLAYPGLPPEGELTVMVDALEDGDTGMDAVRIGRAGPVVFTENGLLTTPWQSCEGDCEPCRQEAALADPEDTRLLAVRFLGLER